MASGGEDEQVCEIYVKQMYLAVEKKVTALLVELLREVGNGTGVSTAGGRVFGASAGRVWEE